MSSRLKHVPVLGALAVLAALGIRTVSNSGIWLHLATGRLIAAEGIPRTDPFSFSLSGQSWVNGNWLYDVLVYATWQVGGASAMILLHVAAVALAFILLLPVARSLGDRVSTATGLLLSAWLLTPVFTPSPGILALVFPALYVRVMWKARPAWRVALALLPLQWVWAHTHGSFLLGPFLCVVFGAEASGVAKRDVPESSQRTRDSRRAAFLFALAVLTLLIPLAGPYGLSLYRHAVLQFGNVASGYVMEWISPFSWMFQPGLSRHAVTLALLVGAAGLILDKDRLPAGLTGMAVLAAVLAVLRPHSHDELFALLGFPFFVLSIHSAGGFLLERVGRKRNPSSEPLPSVAACLVTVAAMAMLLSALSNRTYRRTGSASEFGLGVQSALFPEAAAPIIEHKAFPARAVNLPLDGGYLAWRYPGRKIFVDQRASLYGGLFYQRFADALSGNAEDLEAFLESWLPDAYIINCTAPRATRVVVPLLADKRWGLVYFDGTTAIILRRSETNAALFQDAELQKAGVQIMEKEAKDFLARLQSPVRPANPARLIGAANLYMELQLYEQALPIYGLLAKGTTRLSAAWVGLGFCHLQLGQTPDAVAALETACRRFKGNAQAWLWLSRAYAQSGDMGRAQVAFDRAGRLDPNTAARFGRPEPQVPGVIESIPIPAGPE